MWKELYDSKLSITKRSKNLNCNIFLSEVYISFQLTRGLGPGFASLAKPPGSLRFVRASHELAPLLGSSWTWRWRGGGGGGGGGGIGMGPRQRHLWSNRWLRLPPARRPSQWSQKVGPGRPHHGPLASCGENKSFAVTKTFLCASGFVSATPRLGLTYASTTPWLRSPESIVARHAITFIVRLGT